MATPQLTLAESIFSVAFGAVIALVMLAFLANWRGIRDLHIEKGIRNAAVARKGPLRRLPGPGSSSLKRFSLFTALMAYSVLFVSGVALMVLGVVTLFV